MEKTFEPNYTLNVGDVVLIKNKDFGFIAHDIGKYAEVIGKGDYFGRGGVEVKLYGLDDEFTTASVGNGTVGVNNVVGYESFGENPMILLNTFDENDSIKEDTSFNSSLETRKNGKNKMELVETGFPNAFLALGGVMSWAADYKGYRPHDWANIPNPEESFIGAATRHRLKSEVQKNNSVPASERTDDESGLLHKTHELFNVLAQLELILRGKIK